VESDGSSAKAERQPQAGGKRLYGWVGDDSLRPAHSPRQATEQRSGQSGRILALLLVSTLLLIPGGLIGETGTHAGSDRVLVFGPTVRGGTSSTEARAAAALGFDVEVVDEATWAGMTKSEFSAYRALIVGDTGGNPSTAYDVMTSNATVWGAAVTGNVLIAGTDPEDHGGQRLTQNAVAFAADVPDKTGMYLAMSDTFGGAAQDEPVTLLDGLSSGGFTFGSVGGCYEDAHIVAVHPVLSGLTDSDLSDWTCSVHNAFNKWPGDFIVLAIAKDTGNVYTAPDGTIGTPYILARGEGLEELSSYVALGDSVAAGEGLGYGWSWKPDAKGSDGTWVRRKDRSGRFIGAKIKQHDCHRNSGAYPDKVADALGVSILKFACTGSTANHFKGEGDPAAKDSEKASAPSGDGVLRTRKFRDSKTWRVVKELPQPQLGFANWSRAGESPPNAEYDNAHPDLVTLTVGANDVNFGGTVGWCYLSAKGIALGLPDYERCDESRFRRSTTFPYSDAHVDKRLRLQRAALERTLSEIRSRGVATGKVPLVAVTTYYDPFPASDKRCRDILPKKTLIGQFGLTWGEIKWLRGKLKVLNQNIRDVVSKFPNVTVVELTNALDKSPGHRWCSGNPWVYGPSLMLESGGKWSNTQHAANENDFNPAPFHPTLKGQAAIANRVTAALSGHRFTAAGSNVTVGSGLGVKLTFAHVQVSGQTVIADLLESQQDLNRCPTADFFVPRLCFDVTTSAQFSGPVTLAIPYPRNLPLYHFLNGAWVQVPTTYGVDGVIRGTTTSLSPFALGDPAPEVHAAFSSSGESVAPAAVTFDATASTVQSGSITKYSWDFGDGQSATGATVTHSFASSGTYDVRLTVTSDQAAISVATGNVQITNPAPVAVITPTAVNGTVGDPISLSGDQSSDANGKIQAYAWDFGDGSPLAEGATASHRYAAPGTYQVRLSVFDAEQESATTERLVRVDAAAPFTG
jgi:PKD repeat protein